MAQSGSYRWGLSPNTYMLPQPFGHIVSWRTFKRNKVIPTPDYDIAMCIKELNVDNDPTDKFTSDTTDYSYKISTDAINCTLTIIKDESYTDGVLGIKTSESSSIIDGCWVCIENKETEGMVTLKTITQLIKLESNNEDIDVYQIRTFSGENLNIELLNNDAKKYDVKIYKITDMKLKSNGWRGDPRNITEKSNAEDPDSWHIEIVTQHTNESNIRDAKNWKGHTFPATRWTAINAIQRICDQAASTMIEYLVKEYNKGMEEKFQSIKQKEASELEDLWTRSFQELQIINKKDGGFAYTGGYLLLKDQRNKRKAQDDPKKSIVINFPGFKKESADAKRYKLLEVNEEGNPMTTDETVGNNNTRISNCIIDEHVYVKPIESALQFLNGASTEKTDEHGDMFRRPYQALGAVPDQEVRMRLHLTSGGVAMNQAQDTDALLQPGVSQFDSPALPFEYDLHKTNIEQFNREFETALRLIAQCLLATVEMQSPKESGEPLDAVPPKTFPFNVDAVSNSVWGETERMRSLHSNKKKSDTGLVVFMNASATITEVDIEKGGSPTFYQLHELYKAGLKEWNTYKRLRKEWIPPNFFTQFLENAKPLNLNAVTIGDNPVRVYNARKNDENSIVFDLHQKTSENNYKGTYKITYTLDVDKLNGLNTESEEFNIGLLWSENSNDDTTSKKYFIAKTNATSHKEKLDILCVESKDDDANTTAMLLEKYINNTDPWRQENDNEYGACATLLWKPCLEYASNYKNERPGVDSIGKLLMNVMPFGMMSDEKSIMVNDLIQSTKTNFNLYDSKTGNMKYILLEQSDYKTNPMPWEPLTLQYGISMTGSDFSTCQWAIGCEPTLLIESVQILLIYLQKLLVHEATKSKYNTLEHIQRREDIVGWDTYPYGMCSIVHTSINKDYMSGKGDYFDSTDGEIRPIESIHGLPFLCDKCINDNNDLRNKMYEVPKNDDSDDTTHFYSHFIPGKLDFYKTRSFIRKEIEYEDTLFNVTSIDAIDSRDPSKMKKATQMTENPDRTLNSKNKWTGMFLYDTLTTDDYPSQSLYFLKSSVLKTFDLEDRTSHKFLLYDVNWGGVPVQKVKGVYRYTPFSGMGTWKTDLEYLPASTYTRQRYRKYTGKTPSTTFSDYSAETIWRSRLFGPSFNSTIKNTKWILPDKEIKSGVTGGTNIFSPDKDGLASFLSDTFVGWHYSNNKALGRTVFALACNKFYTKVVDYFSNKDPEYHEERGIRILSPPPPLKDEAKLLHLIYKGSPQSPLGYTKTNPMVVKGIVSVKGNGVDALTTSCIAADYLCKTESYRIIESEVWSVLLRRLLEVRGIPPGSVSGCLASIIKKCNLNEKRALRIRELVKIRPPIVSALARIMVALHIHNATWIDTQKFRDRDSVELGMCTLKLLEYIRVYTYVYYMYCAHRYGIHTGHRIRDFVSVLMLHPIVV